MTGTRFRLRRAAGTLAALGALLTVASACGDDESGGGGLAPGGEDKGTVELSGQNFTEMQIMAEMYSQVLEAGGYTVEMNLVDTRDLYLNELSSGRIDVVPEYVAGIADYLNTEANGSDAETITTNDPQETLDALEPLATEAGITMLEPAQATDQNAFVVSQEVADDKGLTTLSDVADLGPVVLAAAPDCEGRPDCEAGLTEVYGIDIQRILPTGFGTQQTKDAVLEGEAALGLTGTTDGSLDELGLVILEDDQGIQPAQNLIPAVNTEFLDENPDVANILNELSATLTTDDLASLNAQVDIERQQPADVAQAYLEEKALL